MAKAEVIIDAISNGLGSQSMLLMLMAARGIISSRVSLTADTGSENDCVWSSGERTTAKEYFERIVHPYAVKHNIDARFVRAVDKDKNKLLPLMEQVRKDIAEKGRPSSIPLYGSRGGQQIQSCTDKWKIRAIRQEARRMGATKLITAQGIHFAEAGRRVKGAVIGMHGEWTLYQDTYTRKIDEEKIEVPVKWCNHYYPLVDRGYGRKTSQQALAGEGIPYLVSSQCDECPHNDLDRWMRHTPEVLHQIAEMEATMDGKFFFTDERVPLMEALERKKLKPRPTVEAGFGCGNSYCGI